MWIEDPYNGQILAKLEKPIILNAPSIAAQVKTLTNKNYMEVTLNFTEFLNYWDLYTKSINITTDASGNLNITVILLQANGANLIISKRYLIYDTKSQLKAANLLFENLPFFTSLTIAVRLQIILFFIINMLKTIFKIISVNLASI